jgi:hypothetical protein
LPEFKGLFFGEQGGSLPLSRPGQMNPMFLHLPYSEALLGAVPQSSASSGVRTMSRRLTLVLLLSLSPLAWSQSPRSAIGGEGGLWAGGEASVFNPDFSCSSNIPFHCTNQLVGPTVFFDFNMYSRYSAEGEARWLHWNGYNGQIESNYLIGPRYQIYRYHRLNFWLKFMFGGGWITTPGYPVAGSLKGSYFAYAPGGAVDYRLTNRLSLRADYEYQLWPSFAGPETFSSTGVVEHNHGLTPNGFSFGVAYRFLGQ